MTPRPAVRRSPRRGYVIGCLATGVMLGLAGCGDSHDPSSEESGGSARANSEEPAPSLTSDSALSVSTSIKPDALLAKPVVWSAAVNASEDITVDHVDFLIDGKVRWTERSAPYEFNEGRPFAAWPLGAGAHELRVRAVASTGEDDEAPATVHVKRGSQPPRLATGSYSRMVTAADVHRVADYRDAPHGAFGDPFEPGRWMMQVRPDGVITLDVEGGSEFDPFFEPFQAMDGGSLEVYGPALWLQSHPEQGSIFCDPEDVGAYRWSVTERQLTITAVDHTCADRDTILVGTWQRG